jgi:tetratricopeptide (TPR) repeat protein
MSPNVGEDPYEVKCPLPEVSPSSDTTKLQLDRISRLSLQKRELDVEGILDWVGDLEAERRVMFIKGQAGSGKSRLIRQIVDEVEATGWHVLDLTKYDYETIGPAIENVTAEKLLVFGDDVTSHGNTMMWTLHPISRRQHTKILGTVRYSPDWWDDFIETTPNAEPYAAWIYHLSTVTSLPQEAHEVVRNMVVELGGEAASDEFFAETEGNALDLAITALMQVDANAAESVIRHFVDEELGLLAEVYPEIRLDEIAIGTAIAMTHTSPETKVHAASTFFGSRGKDILDKLVAICDPSATGFPLTLRGEILNRALRHRPDVFSVLLDLVPNMRLAIFDLVSRVSRRNDEAWNATVAELSTHFVDLAPHVFEVAAHGAPNIGDLTLEALRRSVQPEDAAELVKHTSNSLLPSAEMTTVASELCTLALDHARLTGDKSVESVCYRYLSLFADISGHFIESTQLAQQALDTIDGVEVDRMFRARTVNGYVDSMLKTPQLVTPEIASIGEIGIELHRQELQNDPAPATYQSMANALANLGMLYRLLGEDALATIRQDEALELMADRYRDDPAEYDTDYAYALRSHSISQCYSGNHASASAEIAEAIAILRRAAAIQPDTYQADLRSTLTYAASYALHRNDPSAALDLISECIELGNAAESSNPAVVNTRRGITAAQLFIFHRALQEVGDKAAANEALNKAIRRRQEQSGLDDDDSAALGEWIGKDAAYLLGQGRPQEAVRRSKEALEILEPFAIGTLPHAIEFARVKAHLGIALASIEPAAEEHRQNARLECNDALERFRSFPEEASEVSNVYIDILEQTVHQLDAQPLD